MNRRKTISLSFLFVVSLVGMWLAWNSPVFWLNIGYHSYTDGYTIGVVQYRLAALKTHSVPAILECVKQSRPLMVVAGSKPPAVYYARVLREIGPDAKEQLAVVC